MGQDIVTADIVTADIVHLAHSPPQDDATMANFFQVVIKNFEQRNLRIMTCAP